MMRPLASRQRLTGQRWTATAHGRATLLRPPLYGVRGVLTSPARYGRAKTKGKVEEVVFSSMSSTPDKPTLHSSEEVRLATPRKSKAKSKSDGKRIGTQPYPSMTVEESDRYDSAVESGEIPNTELSKVVFRNWVRFPGCTVLVKVGSFYESYYQPALELSETLGIKLTHKKYSSDNKVTLMPFCGFPTVQLDKYLRILVTQLGRTVVVIEETDERTDTDLKERRVGRVVTPGTMLDDTFSAGGESRYLLAISVGKTPSKDSEREQEEGTRTTLPLSLAYTDAATGDFFCKDSSIALLEDELIRIAPKEVVLDIELRDQWDLGMGDPTGADKGSAIEMLALIRVLGFHISFADPVRPAPQEDARGVMLPRAVSEPTSREGMSLETQSISILRHHLEYTFRDTSAILAKPKRQAESAYMHIDAATLQALEIRHALRFNSAETHRGVPLSRVGTLLSVLDETVTNAGHRLLLRTLTAPSAILPVIVSRQELVQAFVDRNDLREELRSMLRTARDVARSLQRLRGYRGDPDDLWTLATWIRMAERLIAKIKFEVEVARKQAGKGQKGKRQLNSTQLESLNRLEQVVKSWGDVMDIANTIEGSMRQEWLTRAERSSEGEEGMDDEGELMAEPTSRSAQKILQEIKFKAEASPDEDKTTEAVRWLDFAERARMDYQESFFWLQPNASTALRRAHNRLAALRKLRDEMQEKLRSRFGPELVLTWWPKSGYWVNLKECNKPEALRTRMMKQDAAFKRPKAGKTHVLYDPYTELGKERDKLIEDIEEYQIQEFARIKRVIREKEDILKQNSDLIDEIDLTLGFATTAMESSFVRPTMTNGTEMQIINGRHPTVEAALNASIRPFTPNSTIMSPGTHLQVITGPNQGGKSTLLRQTAVIAILAQAGSFVPADSATIGIVDKVFSRVGARDDLFRDRSTFMLEMVETASILKYATDRSLVIMDEIGRGTTLQAGMSIAYSTLEYILTKIKCRTLFATHYHELGGMLAGDEEIAKVDGTGVLRGDAMPKRQGVEFWCTDVNEIDGAFSYSYKLQPGINFNSHAIKAARIAGMPSTFLRTASATLEKLQTKYAQAQQIISRLSGRESVGDEVAGIPSIDPVVPVKPGRKGKNKVDAAESAADNEPDSMADGPERIIRPQEKPVDDAEVKIADKTDPTPQKLTRGNSKTVLAIVSPSTETMESGQTTMTTPTKSTKRTKKSEGPSLGPLAPDGEATVLPGART